MHVRGGGRGHPKWAETTLAEGSPRLSLLRDPLRTVLAIKGSLRRAQQQRALDGLRAVPGQPSQRRERPILVPFFSATDTMQDL